MNYESDQSNRSPFNLNLLGLKGPKAAGFSGFQANTSSNHNTQSSLLQENSPRDVTKAKEGNKNERDSKSSDSQRKRRIMEHIFSPTHTAGTTHSGHFTNPNRTHISDSVQSMAHFMNPGISGSVRSSRTTRPGIPHLKPSKSLHERIDSGKQNHTSFWIQY